MWRVLNLNHFWLITVCSENRHASPYALDLSSVSCCNSSGDEKWSGFINVGMSTCFIYISSGMVSHYWNVFVWFWGNISFRENLKALQKTVLIKSNLIWIMDWVCFLPPSLPQSTKLVVKGWLFVHIICPCPIVAMLPSRRHMFYSPVDSGLVRVIFSGQ